MLLSRPRPSRFHAPHLGTLAIALTLLIATGCAAPQRVDRPLPEPLLATQAPPRLPSPPVARPPVRPPAPPTAQSLRGVRIVVDAGHGGHDPGALGVGPLPEKKINLGVTRRLVELLQARGAAVTTTRLDDTFIELDDRARLADRTRADVFLSIHSDAAHNRSASGATFFIARNARPESVAIANRLHAAFEQAGIESRGVRRAGFRVLVGHARPAVLIECGFLTNRREARLLATADYQDRLADAITAAVVTHFDARRQVQNR